MPSDQTKFWRTEEWTFVVLRALAMLGGMVALFLVPLRPEHQPHLAPLAWAFVTYKACLFLAIRVWPGRLPGILLGTVGLDLIFVSLFVWFSGGIQSHFYLLFYLLVALAAVHFRPGFALGTAGGAGLLYVLASVAGVPGANWQHLSARVATFFLLGGALAYLSERERLARAKAEQLNEELRQNQARLEKAYQALQAAQERLVQSERLATIGQLSAKVSHEVRNPLSAISLNAELLEDEVRALPEDRRGEAANLLAAIRSQVDVLGAVTEEYLRYARLPKPKLEAAALAPVIEELAEFVRGELWARGVRLVLAISNGLPMLSLDPGQIRQALLNLIRNAAEAMPHGGTLTIRAFQEAAGQNSRGAEGQGSTGAEVSAPPPPRPPAPLPSVVVEVCDTGVGIPADHLDQIFEPFFTTKNGGTGLGLAITRQIALDHGGGLTCASRPGGGTVFRLTLVIPTGAPTS